MRRLFHLIRYCVAGIEVTVPIIAVGPQLAVERQHSCDIKEEGANARAPTIADRGVNRQVAVQTCETTAFSVDN